MDIVHVIAVGIGAMHSLYDIWIHHAGQQMGAPGGVRDRPGQPAAAHYHRERNHQGLGNRLITPETLDFMRQGDVARHERLG